jgi:hypothetical protein
LRGRADRLPPAEIEKIVRRWYVASTLTGRYAGNPETTFDFDIRQIESRDLRTYANSVVEGELTEGFWNALLPQQMETSSIASPYFLAYQAAQVKFQDKGFLSRDITVLDLLLNRSDVHHVYPRDLLKRQGLSRGRYNQIANFVLAQSEINIAIGNKPPEIYFSELREQCNGGAMKYGGIRDLDEMRESLFRSCVPVEMLEGRIPDYNAFLEERRKLMARKLRAYFETV